MEKGKNNLFIIVLLLVVLVAVFFFPMINKFITSKSLPKVETSKKEDTLELEELSEEMVSSFHRPLMRNSVYEEETYYSLDKFTISNMSNNDILYNAFLDIEDVVFADNGSYGCTNSSKQFSTEKIGLRIKNILGKNVKYKLESFNVFYGSSSKYFGTWVYDEAGSRFVYSGSCNENNKTTKYYNLEEYIKAEYNDRDVVAYYYVGFAKVEGDNYTIYSDPKMTKAIVSGKLSNTEELNSIYKDVDKKNKKVYMYTFKNTLCSYSEYCLYEGRWTDGI